MNTLEIINIDPWILMALFLSILPLKIISMWMASKRDNLAVFIILAILQTIGIAEVVYILYTYIKEKREGRLIK